MNSHLNKKSLTLIELLIAIGLLSVIILAISNIDLFTRFHTISADRRVKLQNEVSYVLEHMGKEIARAIGNERLNNPPTNTVAYRDINPTDALLRVYIDANGNGRRDTGAGTDRWIAYRLIFFPAASRYQMWYCPQCTNFQCTFCVPPWGTAANILSRQIRNFTPTKPGGAILSDNFVDIQLTARWQPSQAASPDNPEVTMRTRIKMPSVSTN